MADTEINTDLDSLIHGGEASLGAVFARHQRPLERMIELGLDERMRGRVDPQDVLQEAFIEASRHMAGLLHRHHKGPKQPPASVAPTCVYSASP